MRIPPPVSRAFVAGVLVAGGFLWLAGGQTAPPSVQAQVPDSGLQRRQMIEELRGVNEKLTQVIKLLTEMKEAQAQPDKGEGHRATPRQP